MLGFVDTVKRKGRFLDLLILAGAVVLAYYVFPHDAAAFV
jgi:hypothetical protein